MGQSTEGSSDAQNIAKNLIETIISEALAITERKGNCFENLKIEMCTNKTVLDCDDLSNKYLERIKGIDEQEGINYHVNSICYRSLADLPEVCVHSSSLSNSSKQGEGDYHPDLMKEATAFCQLELNKNLKDCCLDSTNCKGNSNSSLNTETSHNDLIESLQNNVYNLSFDNIQLSDSEVDDGPQIRSEATDTDDLSKSHSQDVEEFDDFSFTQDVQQSQKFCQFNNTQYLPFSVSPDCNESESFTGQEKKKYVEHELCSDSSHELVIIEGETVEHFIETYPFSNPYLYPPKQSVTVLSQHFYPEESPDSLNLKTQESHAVTTVADVKPVKEQSYWEEEQEIQVNVTEPMKNLESGHEIENNDIIQSRRFWSNVGLMSENIINPKYLGPTVGLGIESIKGIRRVEEKCLAPQPEEVIWVTEPQALEDESLSSSSQGNSDTLKVDENYLSFPDKIKKSKKRNRFMTRLIRSLANIFISKKKSTKH